MLIKQVPNIVPELIMPDSYSGVLGSHFDPDLGFRSLKHHKVTEFVMLNDYYMLQ
jgi:hypothetical protein